MNKLCSILFLTALLLPIVGAAQALQVSGKIIDGESGEKIPYANIYFKASTIGCISDSAGKFDLKSEKQYDSLVVKVLGYQTKTIGIKGQITKDLTIELHSDMYQLSEVKILPGENPAWEILRRAIANKEKNRPQSEVSYSYESYDKIQFDLNHFTEKIQNNIILRPFDFIWEHVDSTDDGVAYLPILLIENISDHYYRSEDGKQKTIVKGNKSTGLEGPKIMEFVQDMYIDPNFYDNYVNILEKNFPSPLNDNYKTNYRFYLTDSLEEDGEEYYLIVFKPRSFNSLAFDGQMLLHKGTYALKRISLRFDIRANVNFVRSYWIQQEFEQIEGKYWMRTKSQILGDFTVLENQSEMTGFYGRKSTSLRNIQVGVSIPDSVFKGVEDKLILEDAETRDNAFWEESRHVELDEEEQDIERMVDQVEEHPAFIFRKNLVNAIWNGYYPKKFIDLGDLYTFYSYNQVEYSRFKLAFRTNESLMKNTQISLFGAYGMRDSTFKYGGDLVHTFKGERNRFLRLGGHYKYDIEQLGWSYNFIPIDHVIASLIQINLSETRMYNERMGMFIERQWFTGFTTRLAGFQHSIQPNKDFSFFENQDSTLIPVEGYRRGGGQFSFRFAKGEREGNADYFEPSHRWKMRGAPIFSGSYWFGVKDFLGSQFDFHEVRLRIDHRMRFKKWGYTNYLIEGGKVWGNLPYQFLQIPYANEVVIYDKIAYNLMNYLEFVNDEFAQLQVEHHFEGILFSAIPLIKKTKLRSLVFGKVYAGRISEANKSQQYLFATNSFAMKEPYYEAGFGIENILKIARIDVVWRLNYLEHENVYPFIIKPSFQFNF